MGKIWESKNHPRFPSEKLGAKSSIRNTKDFDTFINEPVSGMWAWQCWVFFLKKGPKGQPTKQTSKQDPLKNGQKKSALNLSLPHLVVDLATKSATELAEHLTRLKTTSRET